MKKRELEGLIRRISERYPELVHADRVLYETPVNSILRGIVFSTFIRSPRQVQVASFARVPSSYHRPDR